jgi:hypothetical protein
MMNIDQLSFSFMLRLPSLVRTVMTLQDRLPAGGVVICQIDKKS